ncbi:DUF4252 domain-containing protein [Prevotella corporis]|jgi:hypothetical protein|uniref:DUF4252 domain-containing protein n=1 Tax=Prevotella corporis TaxID=28128 RepID=UPI0023F4DFC5|nr:DUF4252 domain-containing protein [Prevotella corporis]
MKSIIIALALLATSLTGWAQTINDVFKKFKEMENVTYVNIPKSVVGMALKSAGKDNVANWADKIDAIQVLSLEEASATTKQLFNAEVKKLDTSGYEDMIKVNSEGEKVRILTKGTEKIITSLIIFAIDEEDCSLVKIDGRIAPDEVNAIVDDQTRN